jgi:RHS repeat-associated protein
VTDASGTTAITYDAQGRVTARAQAITSGGYATPFTTGYQYDRNGKVTQIAYPSGDVVNITRATDGLATAMTFTPHGGTAQTVIAGAAYEPFGPLASLTYGNGLNLTRGYDQDYRLTGITLAPATGSALMNVTYGWQADGRLSTVTDNLTPAQPSRAASYGYTPAGRVLSGVGAWGSYGYGYDASGNLTLTGPTSAPVTATVSATSNQIVSAVGNGGARALSYLPGGALAEDGSATGSTYLYSYNASKRLAKVQVNPAAPTLNGLYAYDYQGRRVWRQNGNSGAQTAYVYDEAGHVLAEQNAAAGGGGATAREYIWLDDALIGMPIYVSGNPVPRFVTTGQIDDPRIVTLTSQAISWNGYTDPFGQGATFSTPTNLLNLRYPGQWFQGETSAVGLSQNGYRDYDPTLGRYIETDPLGIEAGANVYAYVDGDPVNAIDPMGLVNHTTGQTYNCGQGCWIRIDYTFDPDTGVKTRHLHWECRGNSGECGENGASSHGGTWEDAPERIKECARKHGFNGAPASNVSPRVNPMVIGGAIGGAGVLAGGACALLEPCGAAVGGVLGLVGLTSAAIGAAQ